MSRSEIARPARRVASVLKSLRYLFGRRPFPIERPVVVQFPVNDICDSKCQMCNIWQQKLDQQIDAGQARTLFSSPLFADVVSIGFNGGEPTLRKDLPELADAVFAAMPRLRQVSLITNGLHSGRAIERIAGLATAVRRHGGRLDVMVSLDGVGDVHDRVRGVAGNFGEAVKVLDFLLARPDLASTRVGCTIITDNAYHVHELHDFCVTRGAYVKFRLGVPNKRLYNLPSPGPKTIGKRTWIDTHPFGLDDERRWHVAQFLLGLARSYEPGLRQVQFYRSLAAQVAYGAPRRAGCDWQHRGVTVTSRGQVAYCAVQSDLLGDGLATDPQALYFDNVEHLRRIVQDKCASCAHDYVGVPGGRDQTELVVDQVLHAFGSTLAAARRSRPYSLAARANRALVEPWRMQARRRRLRHGESAAAGASPRTGVLLCGWYGTETLGDKAILATVVAAVRRELAASEAIVVASLDPVYTRLTVAAMPELAGCEVVDVDTALATVAERRALVFSGGPLMAIAPMAQMESLFRRARLAGVPAIVAGCGVGPLGSAAANASIRGLLDAADVRIFRDEASRAAAERMLGARAAGDAVCEDPAVAWAASGDGGGMPESPVLGLGLRDWPHEQYARHLGLAGAAAVRARFEAALVQALERRLLAEPRLRILPIPFCAHDAGGDDRLLYWRLLQRSPALRAATDTALLSREPSPEQALQAMRGCTAFLAMRFHSLVFAGALGLPVAAVDYTLGAGKTHALGVRLGCPMLRLDRIDTDALDAALAGVLVRAPSPSPPPIDFPDTFARAWAALPIGRIAP